MNTRSRPAPGRIERSVRRLAALLLARPRLAVAISVAVLLACGSVAMELSLDGSFASLLPENDPDVAEFDDVMEEVGGSADMVVAVSGDGRLAFARRLVGRLRAEPFIRAADVEYPVDFFLDRRLLMLPVADLARLRARIHSEVQRARSRANPFYVDLEDETPAGERWKALTESAASARAQLPAPTQITRDGRWLLVRVRPLGGFSDMDEGARVLSCIERDVEALDPRAHGVSIRYAGALPMNQEQNTRMNEDLRKAAALALGLIVLVIAAAFRRLAAPVVLALPLLVGVAATLALARLAYGSLNLVSAFLVSTLFGLGIDYGLHLYLRYTEHLGGVPAESLPPRAAMTQAMVETLRGSNTAALTTIAAFVAVATSAFRGFQEFGTIAATGILFTLIATYLVLPPLGLLLIRRAPPACRSPTRRNIPRALAWIITGAGLACTAMALAQGPGIRWEGDYDKLRGCSALVDFSHEIEVEQGGVLAPALLRVDSYGAARRLGRYLDARAEDPSSQVRRTLSLASMLPPDPERSMALLADMKRDLDGLSRADLDAVDRTHVAEARRLVTVRPWTVREIPAAFRAPLETKSGTGALLAVWPRSYMRTQRDVMAWAQELHQIQHGAAGFGVEVGVLDENVLAAKVLSIAHAEMPRAVVLAALAVMLILILDFRRVLPVVMVTGSLAVGLLWMVGIMRFFDIELNAFNQAVLPTIVGMGLDNSIHIEHRYAALGRGSLPRVLRTTGFAALLAAGTTAVGFGATIGARHTGVRSMGELALVGFACTFVSGTLLLPMARRLLEDISTRPRGPLMARAGEPR